LPDIEDGEYMGLLQRRMDEHAHDCEVAYRLLERGPSAGTEAGMFEGRAGRADSAGLVAEGKVFAAALRSGDPPNLDELRWWHRRTRVSIQALKETDPDAVVSYLRALESDKDQRLIRGM
jgi:hypothetical protein